MLRLILARHGETDWNGERRIQGSASDVPLNAAGQRQALCAGSALRQEPVEAIYSSPMARALQTAAAIARPRGLTVAVEPALKEINAGDFEGKTVDALRKPLSEFVLAYGQGEMPRLPGGESLDDLQRRAWPVVERLVAGRTPPSGTPSGTIVVVTHYFTAFTIICKALDFPLATLRRMRIAPGSLNVLGFTERGATLLSLNDTCHLNAGAR